MFKSISLAALMVLATLIGSASNTRAQSGDVVAPVPGPYQSARRPSPPPTAFSASPMGRMLPYWMRPQQPRTGGADAAPGRQQYIQGWVWSPYAPNSPQGRNRPAPVIPMSGYGFQNAPLPGPGWMPQPYRPGPMPGAKSAWGPPGYANGPAPWGRYRPDSPYRTPPRTGAPLTPNQ